MRTCSEVETTELRLARLQEAGKQLWAALAIPGLEGQACVFRRLEDLQQALETVHRDPALARERRAETREAVRDCQANLQRVRRVFQFLEELLAERTAGGMEAHGGATYGNGFLASGRDGPSRGAGHLRGSGDWEG